MHHCLLIPEILCSILEFTKQYDESCSDKWWSKGNKLRRKTLASLAQTCRALSSPTLDQLWMHLDTLDPLINLLPKNIRKRPLCSVVTLVQYRMKKDRFEPFRRYAARIRILRVSSLYVRPLNVRLVIAALARSGRVSLPLLPNLTELVSTMGFTNTLSFVKFFAGPRLTHLSLLFPGWPRKATEYAALRKLPDLCPNVTSFGTILKYPDLDHPVIAHHMADVVRGFPHLRVLKTSAPSPCVMMALTSKPAIQALHIHTTFLGREEYIGRVPDSIHTLTLVTRDARESLQCLQRLRGSPARFHFQMRGYHLILFEMDAIFQTLPNHLDVTRLRSLTIEFRSLRSSPHEKPSFPLTESLLASLRPFSALHTLDLSSFRSSALSDAAYARIVAQWSELRCLKIGTADTHKRSPVASVGAVIAVLRLCPHLQTLHIVFNGSIPPPRPLTNDEKVEEGKEACAVGRVRNRWGVSNEHITQLHVGHSPVPVRGANVDDKLKRLAMCLKSVMPRLEVIRSEREPSKVGERWHVVQHMLSLPVVEWAEDS